MADLTRNDLKEVFTESLAPFAKAVQEDFQRVNQRFDGIEQRLGGVEQRLDGVEQRLGRVETEVREMKENFSELFAKLNEFISLYKKQEQELTALAAQVRRLEERVAQIEIHQK